MMMDLGNGLTDLLKQIFNRLLFKVRMFSN